MEVTLMDTSRKRRKISLEAARFLFFERERDPNRAKRLAAKQLGFVALRADDLPSNDEVQRDLRMLRESPDETVRLEESRLEADTENSDPPEVDRFRMYELLLAPLEHVKSYGAAHPEGDFLYHSLQVFELARNELGYDEEFLLAALLHDVGMAVEPSNPIPATLDAIDGYVTERTRWLIENLELGHRMLSGDIGARARKRLLEHESGDELVLLARCDREGRVRGGQAPELDEALRFLRELAEE